jgi:hypothetical protein
MKKITIPEHIKLEEFQRVTKKELSSFLDEKIGSNNWRQAVETSDVHSFRAKSENNNSIVGLYVFRSDAPKDECVECYIKKDLK